MMEKALLEFSWKIRTSILNPLNLSSFISLRNLILRNPIFLLVSFSCIVVYCSIFFLRLLNNGPYIVVIIKDGGCFLYIK